MPSTTPSSTTPSSTGPPPILDRPISVSQFYPFVLADSMAKRSRARDIQRTLETYTPAVDYWRLLRLQIMAHHRYGPDPDAPLDALDTAVELAGPDRRALYGTAAANYRRIVGRKRIDWIDQPRRAVWLADELEVRVNPEMHVTINGDPHVVKLYLKADPRLALTQRTANPLAWLLNSCHGHLGRPLVVDVLRGRAFGLTRPNVDYESLLRAQAAALVSLWDSEWGSAAAA